MRKAKRGKATAKLMRVKLHADCWFACGKKAVGILKYLNGDEVPCCSECSKGEIKILRKVKATKHHPKREVSSLGIINEGNSVKVGINQASLGAYT